MMMAFSGSTATALKATSCACMKGRPAGYRHKVILYHREVDEPVHHARVVDGDLAGHVLGGREDHPLCLNLLLHGNDLHPVPDGDTGVCPREVVDPHLPLVPVGDHGPPDLGHRPPLPLDIDDIARGEAELEHGLGIEPDLPRTLVLRVRAVDLQENFRHHLKGHIRGDKKYSSV